MTENRRTPTIVMLNLFQHLTEKCIMEKGGSVYIVGNDRPTLYIGVTSSLAKRIYEHKHNLVVGFTEQYDLHKLLYFEVFDDIVDAIKREKQLKNWHRDWKLNLIRSMNPDFRDLYNELFDPETEADAETSMP